MEGRRGGRGYEGVGGNGREEGREGRLEDRRKGEVVREGVVCAKTPRPGTG